MWKPQVTPLAEARYTSDGPVVTRTSLTTNRQEFHTVSNKYNAKPAPFNQISSNKKMVNPPYNSPMGIYSDDAIAEALSAQAEVLGQGVVGVNFMKNEKTFEGHNSDVLKMVQEMDCEPRRPSPGIVMCGSPLTVGVSHESPVQGQSFRLLERALVGDPHLHSPVSAGNCSVLKPGENICSVCGSLIVGVFVRIKNRNLHDQCFKCATCGISLKNKGYYHVNDRPYCDAHAASAARQNPPGPNLEPITVGPGSPLPTGAMTTSQVLSSKKFSPHSPVSPKMQQPSPSAPGPELLLKEFEPSDHMPTTQQIMQDIPYIPVSHCDFMEQISPKTPEPSIGQIESYIETKASQSMESAGKITRTVKEENKSAGSHVSISGGVESNSSTRMNIDHGKDNEIYQNNFMEERHMLSNEHINDYHKYNLQEINQQTKSQHDQHSEGSSLPPHATEIAISPEVKTQVEDIIPVAEKMEELESAIKSVKAQTDDIIKKVDTVQRDVTAPIHIITQPQSSVVSSQKNTEQSTSFVMPVLGLPDLNTMQLGSSQTSSSVQHANQENKLSSTTQQYTSSSSCYQSFGLEQKSESSSSGMKMTDNITPASSFSAPSPISPGVASPTKHVSAPFPRSTGIGNQQTFGAPSGDINVRAHIPKKGPAPPSSFMPELPKPSAMIPSSPLFDLPKPSMPPGIGGPPQRGIAQIPGQRTAPKRGKGIINPASVSRVPMCATCQRQIRGPFVSALGKTWCPDCFICATSNCRRQLINLGFVEEKGGLHCEDCYERYLAPSCGKCDKKIKGDCLNAIGKHFHPECFCCAYCGSIFGSGPFYLEDGLPYCETDWNDLFTTKCVGCKFPIEAGDRWVEALNNNYHSQCFKCSVCKSNLEGKSFYAKNGRPFCKTHASR